MSKNNPFEYHDDNLYVLGRWFALEREKRGFSLRGIARSTNITPTLISDIENQKIKANIETLVILFNALDMNFVNDSAHLEAVNENITAFYHAIYEENSKNIKNLKDSLIPQFEVLKISLLAVNLVLAEAMIDVEIEQKKPSEKFFNLNDQLDYLNDYQTQKFHLIEGQYYLKKEDLKGAKKAFIKAVEIPYHKRGFAVSYSYLSYIESIRFHPYKAIEYAKIASKVHGKYSNLYRKIHADFIMIKSFIEIHQYEKAQELIYHLSFVLVESNQKYYIELQAFKAYFAFVTKEYKEAVKLMEGFKTLNVFQVFLLVMAHIKLNDKKHAETIIKTYLKLYQNNPNQMAYHLLNITYSKINSHIDVLPSIDYFINHSSEYLHTQVVKELIQIAMAYLYHIKDIDRLYQIQQLTHKVMNNE